MRPEIEPLVLAELIELVPGRVRKRLDNEPAAAEAWAWSESGGVWTIAAGEETVSLTPSDGIVSQANQLHCSCLLSPKCFHLLACCNVLKSTTNPMQSPAIEIDEPDVPATRDSDSLEINDDMRRAANQTQIAIAAILAVGGRNAGLILQSTLLRAGHQCRVANLHSLSNATLRIAEGIQRLRAHEDTADAARLYHDLSNALLSSHLIATHSSVPLATIGQVRRTFEEIDTRRLRGVFAEPILTLSGYAGVCVYLQDATSNGDALYTVNELRPGDSQLVNQAYHGGVDLGAMTIQAKDLCRSAVAVQNLTTAKDGRLGKGKSTRWAVEGKKDARSWLTYGRFAKPLQKQVQLVFDAMESLIDERRGGWDLIAFDATILGTDNAELLVSVPETTRPWPLSIAIDDPVLCYRQNLELLARCIGLSMRCVGRLRPDCAGQVELLAIEASKRTDSDVSIGDREPPRFEFPESWNGLCNVGIDSLQRHHLVGIQPSGIEISLATISPNMPWSHAIAAPIERRLLGITLGGRSAVPSLGSQSHRRDLASLKCQLQGTGSQLLETLAIAAAPKTPSRTGISMQQDCDRGHNIDLVFLACSIYVQHARNSMERAGWLKGFE